MNDRQERIDRALDIAARGAPYEACEVLWPLVRQETARDEAIFAMASCFERAGNVPTAAYLYEWIGARNPEFAAAREGRDRCRAILDERGIFEDFGDIGHVDCPCGEFRYRAELGLCPYCGRRPGETVEAAPDVAEMTVVPVDDTGEGASESAETEEDRVRSPLEEVWKSVQEKFESFTQREDLGETGQRVQLLAKEMSERARQVAESERAQQFRRKLEDVGEEAAKRLRQFAQSEPVQDTTRKSREMGEEAVTRAKAAMDREEVQEARSRLEQWSNDAAHRIEGWVKSEEVRSTSRQVIGTLEGFVAKLQGYIDRAKGAPPEDADKGGEEDRGEDRDKDEDSK